MVPCTANITVSPPDSAALSSGAVNVNVFDPLVRPAGIQTVNRLPYSKPETVKSVPKFAVPPATCTTTNVSDVKTDEDPANSATTVTD